MNSINEFVWMKKKLDGFKRSSSSEMFRANLYFVSESMYSKKNYVDEENNDHNFQPE